MSWKNFCILAQYTLAASNKECSGSEISKGCLSTVDECAAACVGESSMFIFKPCGCYCEVSSVGGVCEEEIDIIGDYKLYRYASEYKSFIF